MHELIGHFGVPHSPLLMFLQAVDIRQIYDKFPEKKGGLKELYDKGPQSSFFLVKFWVITSPVCATDSREFVFLSSFF